MAKQRATINQDLFKSTAAGGEIEIPATGKTSSISVGLRASELEVLEGLSEKYQVSKNALLRLAARRFMEDVINGRFDLEAEIVAPPPPKRRIRFPDSPEDDTD